MPKFLYIIDARIIGWFRKIAAPMARAAIFIVYFWFGLLKILGASPATPLVRTLFERVFGAIMPFTTFYALFASFEILIGILFLLRGWERTALILLAVHLLTTALPLAALPEITWQRFLVPTLEGQYIIKNILIVAAAVAIGARLAPRAAKTRVI